MPQGAARNSATILLSFVKQVAGLGAPEWISFAVVVTLLAQVAIASGEFITGIFVNNVMHWNVCDYTDQPFQLMGQICLPFTIIFSGLCAVGILLSGYLLHFLYGEKKPEFHVL